VSARSQLATAQTRQVALEQELSRRRADADQNEQALHKAEEELRNRPAQAAPDPSASNALAAARIEVARQRDIVGTLDAEREKLKGEVTQLQAQVRAAAGAQQHSVIDESALRAQLGSAAAQAASARTQLAAAQARQGALEQELSRRRAEADTSVNNAVAVARIEVERQRAIVDTLDAQRDKLTAEVTQLQAQVQAATSAQQHSANDESALRAQFASMQAELLDKNSRIEVLESTIQADEKQIAADRMQLAQRAEQRGAQDAEVKQLNEVLKQRETAISDERARLQGMTAELNSDKSQMNALRNQLAQLTSVRGPAAPAGSAVHISDRDLGLGTSFGLIIADAKYKDSSSYQALPAVEKDAQDVKNALARYGYKDHIEPLRANPSRDEIETAIMQLVNKVGPNDSVLIYFAGHGAIDGGNTYWLPSDADPKKQTTWVSTSWISEMIHKTKARHVLVVVDSCYAGAMVRSSSVQPVANGAAAEPNLIRLLARLPSRTVLTSGGNEPVLSSGPGGNSIFARQFIDMLDQNSGVLDGSTLYAELADRVTRAAAALVSLDPERTAQRPRYSVLVDAGHMDGDFLFVPTTVATDSHT
jgi:hypothetical protein